MEKGGRGQTFREKEGKPKLKEWVGEENQQPGIIYTPVSNIYLYFYDSIYHLYIYLSIYQSI